MLPSYDSTSLYRYVVVLIQWSPRYPPGSTYRVQVHGKLEDSYA